MICHSEGGITPSSLLVDLDGDEMNWKDANYRFYSPEELEAQALGRYVGASPGDEFVPLMKTHKPNSRQFRSNYDEHRQAVVKPLFDALAGCQSVAVLVDVVGTLRLRENRVKWFNSNYSIFNEMFGRLRLSDGDDDRSWAERISSLLWNFITSRRQGRVERLAFVVPKLDAVHPDDKDRLEALAIELMGHGARASRGSLRNSSLAAPSPRRPTTRRTRSSITTRTWSRPRTGRITTQGRTRHPPARGGEGNNFS